MTFIAYGLSCSNQVPLAHCLAMGSSIQDVLAKLNASPEWRGHSPDYFYAYIADEHDAITPLLWVGEWRIRS